MGKGNYSCHGVHVPLLYRDGTHWHKRMRFQRSVIDSREIYRIAFRLLCAAPYRKPAAILAESIFDLQDFSVQQLDLFPDVDKTSWLLSAADEINTRYGDFVITPARMLSAEGLIPDRISFGGVKELEEAVLGA
jgi:hypothetical protein